MVADTDQMIKYSYEVVIDIVKDNVDEVGQELADKVEKLAEVMIERIAKMMVPEGKFQALLHNDAWVNNFMFK